MVVSKATHYRIVSNGYCWKVQRKGFFSWYDCWTKPRMLFGPRCTFDTLYEAEAARDEMIRQDMRAIAKWTVVA